MKSSNITFVNIPRYSLYGAFSTRNDYYFSKFCKTDLLVFYKDHEKNINRSLDDKQEMLKGDKNAIVVKATIGEDGKISREIINDDGRGIYTTINTLLVKMCE